MPNGINFPTANLGKWRADAEGFVNAAEVDRFNWSLDLWTNEVERWAEGVTRVLGVSELSAAPPGFTVLTNTGLTVSATFDPTRYYRVTYAGGVTNTVANTGTLWDLRASDGTTNLQRLRQVHPVASLNTGFSFVTIIPPGRISGKESITLWGTPTAGTTTMQVGPSQPVFLLLEQLGVLGE